MAPITDAADPRPIIAAKLNSRLVGALLNSGRAQTERLLNEHIPEGAPWVADWHEPDRFGNILTVTSTAVREWLKTEAPSPGPGFPEDEV